VRARRSSAEEQFTGVLVEVEDSGSGIPEEKQERIFEEFARLQPERAAGTGIGLAMSRKVARALGGELSVRSVAGSGSTFTLFLPSATPSERPRSITRSSPPMSRGSAEAFDH
jgi:signal transduction histidine kinase